MAVTKRTRFEVLRRDNHTCQYCGAKAPDVPLQIDHVVPVALGGTDKPDNLVTACRDCNYGKSSIQPDAPLVQSLSAQAAAYALGMVDKMTRFRADLEGLDDYEAEFRGVWDSWGSGEGDERTRVPLPPDYRMSLFKWQQMGVPVSAFELAIPSAMTRTLTRDSRFAYLGGIIRNMLDERQIDSTVSDETAAVYTRREAQAFSDSEWLHGRESGESRAFELMHLELLEHDYLQHHVDGMLPMYETAPFGKAGELLFIGVGREGQEVITSGPRVRTAAA